MAEKSLLNEILLNAPALKAILFRNNVAFSWAGRVIKDRPTPNGRNIELVDARPIKSGLTNGSSDLVGWVEIEITPEMVGRKVAVFTAIEAKTPSIRVSKAQTNFIRRITEAGGIAGIARSAEEAATLIQKFQGDTPQDISEPEK